MLNGLIPHTGFARIDKVRQHQAMETHMEICVTSGGVTRQVLHEFNFISNNQSRCNPSFNRIGVDKRAYQMHKEYLGWLGQLTRSIVGCRQK